MVTCNLFGGLGNQLFQIAATIGYAKKNGLPYEIPVKPSHQEIHRTFHFPGINYERIAGGAVMIYNEPSHNYTDIPVYMNNGLKMSLHGQFQSEKYFSHCREEILNVLGFKWAKGTGIVSIHVRRGDYLDFPGRFPVVSEDYLNKSINYFTDLGFSRFVFFSDDIIWCKQYAESLNNISIDFSLETDPIQDMTLMSCCEHNIIANSTFSWWGAWLNQNPDKIVVAPENWFGEELAHIDTSDILPENWIKM
jgi:hypothetical protein